MNERMLPLPQDLVLSLAVGEKNKLKSLLSGHFSYPVNTCLIWEAYTEIRTGVGYTLERSHTFLHSWEFTVSESVMCNLPILRTKICVSLGSPRLSTYMNVFLCMCICVCVWMCVCICITITITRVDRLKWGTVECGVVGTESQRSISRL